jgi:hypothetical protein
MAADLSTAMFSGGAVSENQAHPGWLQGLRRLGTPCVQCHPLNREVDKRLTKRIFE